MVDAASEYSEEATKVFEGVTSSDIRELQRSIQKVLEFEEGQRDEVEEGEYPGDIPDDAK